MTRSTAVLAAHRPLAFLAAADASADPADRALADALAAAAPQALRLRPSGAGLAADRRPVTRAAVSDRLPAPLSAWLAGAPPPAPAPRPVVGRLLLRLGAGLPEGGWRRSTDPALWLPHGAALVVAGWGPWLGPLPRLLARRPDMRVVAVLRTPIALDWPEYAAPGRVERLPDAIAGIARHAARVIVPDGAAAHRLDRALRDAGAAAPPIRVEPRPSALAGSPAPPIDPALMAARYMVACGPIEARGNTLLLLHVWRDLAARGVPGPRLVLAGARGAAIEEVAPLLDWSDVLRPLVVEAPDLPAGALRVLLAHARALLAPAFVDSDGALLRDARSCGVPVIAADNPTSRAVLGDEVLSPLDGPGWRAAILAAADQTPTPVTQDLPDWPDYAARLIAHAEAD